jgi:8-oxo-dGTP pyrophosphatase MutT (NUDIX family)
MREISAGIIIFRKTQEGPRFLILYHGKGYWNFPKGKIEYEERSFQTAIREVREETGLQRKDLKIFNNFKAYERFTFWRGISRQRTKIFKIVIFYLAETDRKIILISDRKEGQPHEGFGWFTYREAMKVLTKNADSRKILAQVYNFLQKQKYGGKIKKLT